MSLTIRPLQVAVDWLDEPEFAFANDLTHIDPKVGIPAAGPGRETSQTIPHQ